MLEECVVLAGGGFLDLALQDEWHYSLGFRRGQKLLVEYTGDGTRHSRMAKGRKTDYAFKSVEQLRYDFERDAEDAQRQG